MPVRGFWLTLIVPLLCYLVECCAPIGPCFGRQFAPLCPFFVLTVFLRCPWRHTRAPLLVLVRALPLLAVSPWVQTFFTIWVLLLQAWWPVNPRMGMAERDGVESNYVVVGSAPGLDLTLDDADFSLLWEVIFYWPFCRALLLVLFQLCTKLPGTWYVPGIRRWLACFLFLVENNKIMNSSAVSSQQSPLSTFQAGVSANAGAIHSVKSSGYLSNLRNPIEQALEQQPINQLFNLPTNQPTNKSNQPI